MGWEKKKKKKKKKIVTLVNVLLFAGPQNAAFRRRGPETRSGRSIARPDMPISRSRRGRARGTSPLSGGFSDPGIFQAQRCSPHTYKYHAVYTNLPVLRVVVVVIVVLTFRPHTFALRTYIYIRTRRRSCACKRKVGGTCRSPLLQPARRTNKRSSLCTWAGLSAPIGTSEVSR